MSSHIHTEADLDAALAALNKVDPRFVALLAKAGRPPLRRRADGFAGLAAIIVAQQLSTASANAIWGRLAAAFDPLDPAAILRARPARLRRLGLSAAKVRTLKAIARAVVGEELALAALEELSADQAHAALAAVHGIGPWTADIYLLTALGHADAWPAGDLALQEAARLAFALPARPTAKECTNWRSRGGPGALSPHASCGATTGRWPTRRRPPRRPRSRRGQRPRRLRNRRVRKRRRRAPVHDQNAARPGVHSVEERGAGAHRPQDADHGTKRRYATLRLRPAATFTGSESARPR